MLSRGINEFLIRKEKPYKNVSIMHAYYLSSFLTIFH